MTVVAGALTAARAATAEEISPTARPSRFLRHVHLARGLAIIGVVAEHCWPDFAWSPRAAAIIYMLFNNVSVIFMFVAGLLFQHLSANFRYPAYVRRRFATVVLPYLLISIPAVVAVVFFQHRSDVYPWVYALPKWQQAAFFFVSGKHLAALWFVPMMTLFILASPLWVAIDRRNLYPLLLPVALVFAAILGRDTVPGLFGLAGKAVFMLPAYLAGMCFSRYREAAEGWCERHWLLMVTALVLLSAATLLPMFARNDLQILQKLVAAALIVIAAKHVRLAARAEAGLSRIAEASFPIYFVHGYLITGFRLAYSRYAPLVQAPGGGEPAIFAASVPGFLLHVVIAVAASMAVVAVLKALTGRHSRYLLGG